MAVTLAEIRDRVRNRLSEPVETTAWFTPSAVDTFINDAIRHVFLRIVAVNPDFFGLKTYSFTTVQGTQEYTIPVDVFEIRYVTSQFEGSRLRKLSELSQTYKWDYAKMGKPLAFYWSMNYDGPTPQLNIGFIPTPDAAYDMVVHYISRPKKLVADTDVMDLPDEIADIVVPFATALALKSDKQPAQQEESEFMARLTQYLSFVARGKSGGPQYVNYEYTLW